MCRALSQINPDGSFTGVDIDQAAVTIATEALNSVKLGSTAKFILGDSKEMMAHASNARSCLHRWESQV